MQGGVAGFGFPLPKDSVPPPFYCCGVFARAPASVRSGDAFHRYRCMAASTTVSLYIVHRQAIRTLHTSAVCSRLFSIALGGRLVLRPVLPVTRMTCCVPEARARRGSHTGARAWSSRGAGCARLPRRHRGERGLPGVFAWQGCGRSDSSVWLRQIGAGRVVSRTKIVHCALLALHTDLFSQGSVLPSAVP